MRRPWRESGGLVPWLFLIAVGLVIALLVKKGIIPRTITADRKDTIDALSNIVTTMLLVIGGIFSYLRFFKGRTFSSKLVIETNSGAVRYRGGYLHWVEAQIENKGSVSIWNYDVSVNAILHGEHEEYVTVSEFVPPPSETKTREKLIDIGEIVYEHAFLFVPTEVSAVTFQIVVIDQSKTLWWRSITVKNSDQTKEE